MSEGMGREFTYLSSHATNRYFIPNWGSNDNMDQMVKENYIQIKKDVKDIVANELKRIAEDPDLVNLIKK